MRREETSRKKMTTTQGNNATINTVNIKKQTATVAVAPGVTIQTVKEKEIKGVDEFTAKEVATQVDDDIMTLTKIDDEPSVVQRQPNQYEKLAGEKHMVVDPILVMKRGNIDNMYMKMKKQFIEQLREAELPSDREPPEKPQPKSAVKKIKFKDEKCVQFETNDEPTFDDAEPAEPEEDIY
ncbi:hypothetical protein V3C99_002923 [Haemonchus contortus]